MTPQETEPKLPPSVGGSPVGQWGLTTGAGELTAAVWEGSPWKLFKVAINPITEPTDLDLKAGSPQDKKLPRREHNATHQQITGLQLY